MGYHIHFLIVLLVALASCWQKPPVVEAYSVVPWPQPHRKHHFGETVRIHFRTGNVRYGELTPNDDPMKVFITRSKDAGLYDLREITWIYIGQEQIYPEK